jgi:ABC-2 type transport system permease protein
VLYTPRAISNSGGLKLNAFIYLLWRDLWVTVQDWRSFLAISLTQPIFYLFIFGRLLPSMGQTQGNYSAIILPGIIGMTTVLTAITAVIVPLAMEFGYTKEIEDRLLSPLPAWLVAVQKIVFAAIRGLVAAALMFPFAWLILGNVFNIDAQGLVLLIVVAVLGSLTAATVGLTFGTYVPLNKVNLLLPLVLPPLLFCGCIYYPWQFLSKMRWFQFVTCLTPLTYTSEGLRAALAPQVPHMSVAFVMAGHLFFLLLFGYIGIRGFIRRAVD